MVRKTGNFFIIFFFASMLHAYALHANTDQSLQVMLADLQSNPVSQVEVAVPFMLQVVAKNIDYHAQPEGFDAWDNFAVTLYGQNHAITSVNGATTKQTTFTYVVTPHQRGTFSLPPLSVTDTQAKQFRSDAVKIVVGDSVTHVAKNKSESLYLLQVDLDSKVVYLGQKINAVLRFGYRDLFQDLRITQSGAMENLHSGYVAQTGKPGSLKIDDVAYQTQDYVMELYPQKIGTLVIPAFQATFMPAMGHNHQIASMFAMVMGSGNAVQSQPRSLQVQPLPASAEFTGVTAIGNFESMQFNLSAKQGKVGEGLVAKMIVQGDGNLEVVKAPALQMPEGVHYYEGNSVVQRLDNGKFKKEFEWIVQSDREGTFTIPVQQFVYFDMTTQSYKKLTSGTSSLVISGGASISVAQNLSEEQKKESELLEQSQPAQTVPGQTSSAKTVWQQTLLYVTTLQNSLASTMLSWVLAFLISLLVLTVLVLFSRKYLKDSFFIQTLRYRFQFFVCRRNKDTKAMYSLFETILQKYGLELQSDYLHQYFIKLGLPEESFGNWQNFVNMILEMNFSNQQEVEQKDLAFSLAKQWFAIILSCCKMHRKTQAFKQVIS